MNTMRKYILTAFIGVSFLGGCAALDSIVEGIKDAAAEVKEKVSDYASMAGDAIQSGLDAVDLSAIGDGVQGMMPNFDIAAIGGGGAPAWQVMAVGEECPEAPEIPARGTRCTRTVVMGGETSLIDIYADQVLEAVDTSGEPKGFAAVHIIDMSTAIELPRRSGSRSFEDLDFETGSIEADLFLDNIRVTQELVAKRDAALRELKVTDIFEGSFRGAPDSDTAVAGLNGVVDQPDQLTRYQRIVETADGLIITDAADPDEPVNPTRFSTRQELAAGSYSKVISDTHEDARITETRHLVELVDEANLSASEIKTFADGVTEYSITTIDSDSVTVFAKNRKGGTVELSVTSADDTGTRTVTRTVKPAENHPVSSISETGTLTDTGATIAKTVVMRDGTEFTESLTITKGAKGVSVSWERSDGTSGDVSITDEADGTKAIESDILDHKGNRILTSGLLREDRSAEIELEIDLGDNGSIDATGNLSRSADGHLSGTITATQEDGTTTTVTIDMDPGDRNPYQG